MAGCHTDDVKNTYTISGSVMNAFLFNPNPFPGGFDTLKFSVNLILDDQIIATDDDGIFTFTGLEEGKSYIVIPKSVDNGLYGTTALDFVIIRKFTEGIDELDEIGEVAADVNKDNVINQTDLDLIWNCLTTNQCPESFRFITEDYNGIGQGFRDQFPVNNLKSNVEINFITVKLGDVNRSG